MVLGAGPGGAFERLVEFAAGGVALLVILLGVPKAMLGPARAERHAFRRPRYEISASFGVVAVPGDTRALADLPGMADAGLYQARYAGRNRVVAAPGRDAAMLPLAAE